MCGETAHFVPGPFLVPYQKRPVPIMAHFTNARLTQKQNVYKYTMFGRLRGASSVVFDALCCMHTVVLVTSATRYNSRFQSTVGA